MTSSPPTPPPIRSFERFTQIASPAFWTSFGCVFTLEHSRYNTVTLWQNLVVVHKKNRACLLNPEGNRVTDYFRLVFKETMMKSSYQKMEAWVVFHLCDSVKEENTIEYNRIWMSRSDHITHDWNGGRSRDIQLSPYWVKNDDLIIFGTFKGHKATKCANILPNRTVVVLFYMPGGPVVSR